MYKAFIPRGCIKPSSKMKCIVRALKKYFDMHENISRDWRKNNLHLVDYNIRHSLDNKSIWRDTDNNIIILDQRRYSLQLNHEVSLDLIKLADNLSSPDQYIKANRKLSLYLSSVNFGKKLPYSKRSTHMKTLKALARQLNRFNITLDDKEWDSKLIEKLTAISTKKYRGFIKSYETANELYEYFWKEINHYKDPYKHNLDLRNALFVRLYQETETGGVWYNRRQGPGSKVAFDSLTTIEKLKRWQYGRSLNWNNTINHYNRFRKYLGYNKVYDLDLDWVPVPVTTKRSVVTSLIDYFSYRKSNNLTVIKLTEEEIRSVIKRYFKKFYNSSEFNLQDIVDELVNSDRVRITLIK